MVNLKIPYETAETPGLYLELEVPDKISKFNSILKSQNRLKI